MNHVLKIMAVIALIVLSLYIGLQVAERTNPAEGFLFVLLFLAIGSAIFVCHERTKYFLDKIIEERTLKKPREAH